MLWWSACAKSAARDAFRLMGELWPRGIECEEWKTSRTSNYGGTYDVSYYFPVNQWVVVRQDYHRLLKQVGCRPTRPDPAHARRECPNRILIVAQHLPSCPCCLSLHALQGC